MAKPGQDTFRMRLGKGDDDIRKTLNELPPGVRAQYVKDAIRSKEQILPLLKQIWDAVKPHGGSG